VSADYYTGPVCYQDGWHYSVDENDQPDKRLYLNEDGSYRHANEDDASWHDRQHGQYVHVALEDGGAGLTVTADELAAIEQLLAERRG
jgi:hypothetical protein